MPPRAHFNELPICTAAQLDESLVGRDGYPLITFQPRGSRSKDVSRLKKRLAQRAGATVKSRSKGTRKIQKIELIKRAGVGVNDDRTMKT